MMNLLNQARILVVAATIGTSIVGGSVLHVQAQRPWHNTQATCEADGYYWDPVKGCADEYCNDGLMGYGDPGETQVWQGHVYMCNGFSGQWEEIGLTLPVSHGATTPLPAIGSRAS